MMWKVKYKKFFVHVIWECSGSRGTAPLILNLSTKWNCFMRCGNIVEICHLRWF